MRSQDRTETGAPDLLELDPVAVAAAVGRLAGARVHALLTKPEEEAGVDLFWFDRAGAYEPHEVSREIDAAADGFITGLATYVFQRGPMHPETLYRHAGGRAWQQESFAYRMALTTFLNVTTSLGDTLINQQAKERLRRAEATAKPPAGLKLEDSIFEPHGSLDELMPHAVEASRLQARAAQEAALVRNTSMLSAGMAAIGDVVGKITGRAKAKAMSVGEAPVGHGSGKKPKRQN